MPVTFINRKPERRGRVAFLFAYGPEVRAFLHSGLVEKIAMTHPVLLISMEDLSTYGRIPTRAQQVVLKTPPAEGKMIGKIRSLVLGTQTGLLKLLGRGRWAHYLEWVEKAPQASFVGDKKHRGRARAEVIYRAGVVAEACAGKVIGSNGFVRGVFRDWNVRLLVASSYFSPRTLPFLQTAHNLGRESLVVTNSWKDVYTTTHVPATTAGLVVNSKPAARDLLDANPHLRKGNLSVCPSLHLEALFHKPWITREEYCRNMGLEPDRPIMCYSTASPRAVKGEEGIIEYLAKAIQAGLLPNAPQLVIRLNPMEDQPGRFIERLRGFAFVRFQEPRWEWVPARDWCAAHHEDVLLWRHTIAHSVVNVSIPSTVTLEFLLDKKPVVNVVFDLNEPLARTASARRFWNAEFYRPLTRHASVYPAFSPEDLVAQVRAALIDGFVDEANEILPVAGVSPMACVAEKIDRRCCGL